MPDALLPLAARPGLRDVYDRYLETLDDGRLEGWPGFFAADYLYRVIPRENFEAGRTLCTMQAESRGMLQDRVAGLTRLQMFAPRSHRRFVSGLRAVAEDEDCLRLRQNVLVVQTRIDRQADIVLVGVAHDE